MDNTLNKIRSIMDENGISHLNFKKTNIHGVGEVEVEAILHNPYRTHKVLVTNEFIKYSAVDPLDLVINGIVQKERNEKS